MPVGFRLVTERQRNISNFSIIDLSQLRRFHGFVLHNTMDLNCTI